MLASAPAAGSSLAQVEAFQATIPRADYNNPAILSLLRSESQSTLGGYWDNVTVITTGYSPPFAAAVDWNGPPPEQTVTEAVWVPNGYTVKLTNAAVGGSTVSPAGSPTPGQWIAGITVGVACSFTLGVPIGVALVSLAGVPAVFENPGYLTVAAACVGGLISASDAVAAVAEQMLGTSNNLSTWDGSTDQAYDQESGYLMDSVNDLVPDAGGNNGSTSIVFADSGTTDAWYSDVNPTGDWGNGDNFQITSGSGMSSGAMFGFQGHFMIAGLDGGGEVSHFTGSPGPGDIAAADIGECIFNDTVSSIFTGQSKDIGGPGTTSSQLYRTGLPASGQLGSSLPVESTKEIYDSIPYQGHIVF